MKYKLGNTQSTTSGSGFVIADENNRPLVSFGYLTAEQAKAAHELIKEALADCLEVNPYYR